MHKQTLTMQGKECYCGAGQNPTHNYDHEKVISCLLGALFFCKGEMQPPSLKSITSQLCGFQYFGIWLQRCSPNYTQVYDEQPGLVNPQAAKRDNKATV